MDDTKPKHGGARPGSGRKSKGEKKRVQMSATVRPETRDTIKDYCNAKQIRLGRLLDTMVKQGAFDVDGFKFGDKVLVMDKKPYRECIVAKYNKERGIVCVRDWRGFGSCLDKSKVKKIEE